MQGRKRRTSNLRNLLIVFAVIFACRVLSCDFVRQIPFGDFSTGVTCECSSPGNFATGANGYRCSNPVFDGSCRAHEACLVPIGHVWHPGVLRQAPCGRKRTKSILQNFGAYSTITTLAACSRTMLGVSARNAHFCEEYENLELNVPNCTKMGNLVPRIIHSVGRTSKNQIAAASASLNPAYRLNRHDDESAAKYVAKNCGEEILKAYKCFIPDSFRADVFRFCALYADGGVYLDEDIVLLHPLDEIISFCSLATVGHDFPTGGVQAKQMKILASAPSAPIFKCALEKILINVRRRAYPSSPLGFTGPVLLHECYMRYPENVAITYKDTHQALWPYTGLRAGNKILAYEYPYSSKHFCRHRCSSTSDYTALSKAKSIYSRFCEL